MTLTAQQVADAIDNEQIKYDGDTEYNISSSEFFSELQYGSDSYTISIDGVDYKPEKVDDYGGMDMGSELWVVFKIGDQLFKKSGWYASHDGSYWDGDLSEVKPVQKTITVFE